MARWNPRRWSLGTVALAAVVIAGCGSATQLRASLRASSEGHLLSLVSRARADASVRDGTAVRAVLGEFVSEVTTLERSGQLDGATATKLERAARATATRAASQLHPLDAHPSSSSSAVNDAASTPASSADAATASTPGTGTTPSRPSTDVGTSAGQAAVSQAPPDANQAPLVTNPTAPAPTQGQETCGSPWVGHHHPNGNGFGHNGFGHPACHGAGHRGWERWAPEGNGGDGD